MPIFLFKTFILALKIGLAAYCIDLFLYYEYHFSGVFIGLFGVVFVGAFLCFGWRLTRHVKILPSLIAAMVLSTVIGTYIHFFTFGDPLFRRLDRYVDRFEGYTNSTTLAVGIIALTAILLLIEPFSFRILYEQKKKKSYSRLLF